MQTDYKELIRSAFQARKRAIHRIPVFRWVRLFWPKTELCIRDAI